MGIGGQLLEVANAIGYVPVAVASNPVGVAAGLGTLAVAGAALNHGNGDAPSGGSTPPAVAAGAPAFLGAYSGPSGTPPPFASSPLAAYYDSAAQQREQRQAYQGQRDAAAQHWLRLLRIVLPEDAWPRPRKNSLGRTPLPAPRTALRRSVCQRTGQSMPSAVASDVTTTASIIDGPARDTSQWGMQLEWRLPQ